MNYLVSEATANKIRDLIGDTGQGVGNVSSGSAHRQVAFVRCVSWDTGTHQGTGQVAQRDASGWSFTGTAGDMLLLAGNGLENLTVDKRYLALRFGRASTQDIFVAVGTDVNLPEFGCGLVQDEDGAWTVDVENIAGDGLTHHITEDGCTIDVVAGCAITLEGGTKVSVDVEALAGCGLTVEGEGTCKQLAIDAEEVAGPGLVSSGCVLAVDTGCGLAYDLDGAVAVYAPDIAGAGLIGSDCVLAVNPGCGISIVADQVRVDSAALAGPGLVTSGTCGLAVNPGCGIVVSGDEVKFDNSIVGQGLRKDANGCNFDVNPGCHITIGGDKIGVEVSGLAGCGLVLEEGVGPACDKLAVDVVPEPLNESTITALTDVSLSVSGCSVTLSKTFNEFVVSRNLCGVVLDVVAGTATVTTQTVTLDPLACITLGDICEFCTGYGEYGGTDPVTPGYCYDAITKTWVACETIV